MAVPKKKKGPIIPGFEDKFAKKLPDNYEDTVDGMKTPDDMKGAVIDCEKVINLTEKEMEEDVALKNAKENVKALGGAYKDTLGCQKAKIKYLLHVMEGRGYL